MADKTNEIKIKRLRGEDRPFAVVPEKSLVRLFLTEKGAKAATLAAGERSSLPTGIALELAEGIEGQITISKHLAELSSMLIINSPGTIDPDYRGEVFVIVQNSSDTTVTLPNGTHLADLRLRRFVHATFIEVDDLDRSKRGSRGIGSTGVE